MQTRHDTPSTGNTWYALLLCGVFFLSIGYYFTSPVNANSDFWWHLSTGQWIAEHSALPDADPFAFSSGNASPERTQLILHGYWLSQLLTLFLFKAGGLTAIIVVKGVLFSATIGVLFLYILRQGHTLLNAAILCTPVFLIARHFDDTRPQLITFLFFMLTWYLLERGLADARTQSGGRGASRSLAVLPLITLIWAHLHPGFIVIYTLLVPYAAMAAYQRYRKGQYLHKSFLMTLGVCAFVTLLNPGGPRAIVWALESARNPAIGDLIEYMPAWEVARFVGSTYQIVLLLSAIACTGILIRARREVEAAHVFLFLLFGVLAATSFRFGIFFIFIAWALMGRYLTPLRRTPSVLISVIIWCAIITYVLTSAYERSALKRGTFNEEDVSMRAIEFIEQYQLPPRVFNMYNWGSFMIWRLWPRYQVMTDSRMLDYTAYAQYNDALDTDEKPVFERYGINTVVMNHIDRYSETIHLLLFSLLDRPDWKLVYFDSKSVIFVRQQAMPRMPAIGKDVFRDLLLSDLAGWMREDQGNPLPYVYTAQILFTSGRQAQALEVLTKAMEMSPDSAVARKWYETIKRMIDEGTTPANVNTSR